MRTAHLKFSNSSFKTCLFFQSWNSIVCIKTCFPIGIIYWKHFDDSCLPYLAFPTHETVCLRNHWQKGICSTIALYHFEKTKRLPDTLNRSLFCCCVLTHCTRLPSVGFPSRIKDVQSTLCINCNVTRIHHLLKAFNSFFFSDWLPNL